MNRLKIINIVGARPNFMKMAPLYKEFGKYPDEFEVKLIHTGQHYDYELALDAYLAEHGKDSNKAEIINGDLLKNKPYITLAPGAKHFTKRWPAEYYSELLERIYQETKIEAVLIGGDDDVEVSENILNGFDDEAVMSLVGQLSIQETAAVIKGSSLLITNDSGLMHIADALGIPTIAIFGPTLVVKNRPVNKDSLVIDGNLSTPNIGVHLNSPEVPIIS